MTSETSSDNFQLSSCLPSGGLRSPQAFSPYKHCDTREPSGRPGNASPSAVSELAIVLVSDIEIGMLKLEIQRPFPQAEL